MDPQGCVGDVRRDPGVDCRAELRANVLRGLRMVGDSLERLDDDVALGDGDREELRRDSGDDAVLVFQRTLARHRGRGADALEPFRRETLANAADEEGDIRALAPAVRVELVEDEEPQAGAVPDDLAVDLLLTGHQELEHHEVREEDVRRVLGDLPTRIVVLLSRVAPDGDRPLAGRVPDELLDLLELAVGQRVHGVDEDGARAARAAFPLLGEDRADDRDEEAERLAGTSPGRDDEALALRGVGDGLLLVLVEPEGTALLRTENVSAARVEHPGRREVRDGRRPLVARVDLDERLGPVRFLRVDRPHLTADVLGVDGGERRRELLVLADDAVAEREDVHARRAHLTTPGLPTHGQQNAGTKGRRTRGRRQIRSSQQPGLRFAWATARTRTCVSSSTKTTR